MKQERQNGMTKIENDNQPSILRHFFIVPSSGNNKSPLSLGAHAEKEAATEIKTKTLHTAAKGKKLTAPSDTLPKRPTLTRIAKNRRNPVAQKESKTKK